MQRKCKGAQCQAITQKGERCKKCAEKNQSCCYIHKNTTSCKKSTTIKKELLKERGQPVIGGLPLGIRNVEIQKEKKTPATSVKKEIPLPNIEQTIKKPRAEECVHLKVKTPLNENYTFHFFYAGEKCDLSEMKRIASKINDEKEVSIPTGESRQFFYYNKEKFYVPLSFLGKRLLSKRIQQIGTNETIDNILAHAKIETEPIYTYKWSIRNTFKVPLDPEKWAAFLFHTEKGFPVAYAFGNTISSEANVHVSLVEVHPEYEGRKLCSTLMRNVFEQIRKRTNKPILLDNVGGLAGYYCYTGAAKANKYRIVCHDCDNLQKQEKILCEEKINLNPELCKTLEFPSVK